MKNVIIADKLSVTPVCLGAMNFGTYTDKASSFDVLDAYVDRGGNFVDTSNNYAHWAPGAIGNESELLLGEWFRLRENREKIILATKVGYDRHGEGAGLSKAQIEYWCDQSLKNMNTDYIDLYYAHVDDPSTPLEETLEAFDSLVKKGKVRALGVSNYDTWRIAEAKNVAQTHGFTPYSVVQQRFSYLHTMGDVAPAYPFNEHVSRERMRLMKKYNLPLVAYSSLAKGGYEKVERMPGEYILGKRLDAIKDMAREKGVSTSALVVAWMVNLYRCEGFTRVIPLFGSSSVKHFIDNMSGMDIALTDEEMEYLNKA